MSLGRTLFFHASIVPSHASLKLSKSGVGGRLHGVVARAVDWRRGDLAKNAGDALGFLSIEGIIVTKPGFTKEMALVEAAEDSDRAEKLVRILYPTD